MGRCLFPAGRSRADPAKSTHSLSAAASRSGASHTLVLQSSADGASRDRPNQARALHLIPRERSACDAGDSARVRLVRGRAAHRCAAWCRCRVERTHYQEELGMNTIARVAEFHHAFGQPSAETPELPESRQQAVINEAVDWLDEALDHFKYAAGLGCRRSLRLSLITEEIRELAEALRDDDLTGTLDALVDLRYVTDGTV